MCEKATLMGATPTGLNEIPNDFVERLSDSSLGTGSLAYEGASATPVVMALEMWGWIIKQLKENPLTATAAENIQKQVDAHWKENAEMTLGKQQKGVK